MTLAKRRLGRRLAGAGVAAASLMLGLEAPAFATPPTISSFSPTSGPTGCVVVITGTNFKDPIVTSVDIGGTPVSEFKVVSGTEIWATVAGDASGTIHVTNADASASSPTDFTNANPGGCSPTITYFAPCGGTAGVIVVIIGTNLLKSSGTAATASVGGDVRFAPYAATAMHTGTPETPTRLEVLVPPGTIDGPIRVSTFNDVVGEGAVLSDTRFEVVPPECDLFPLEQPRSVTLRLRKHLVARGMVSPTTVGDHSTVCVASVPVKIQRRVAGHWKTVGSTTTNDTGAYNKRIKDKPGRYRATAPMIFLFEPVLQTCVRAISPVQTRT
jgi:IPT/TIG domain